MDGFFSSAKFKILMGVLLVLVGVFLNSVYVSVKGGMSVSSAVLSTALTPVQTALSAVTSKADELWSHVADYGRQEEKIRQMEEENQQLRKEQIELDELRYENEQLRGVLQLKAENPDISVEPAMIIERDIRDVYYSFTINKGTSSGILVKDPVITEKGLVGVVVEAGPLSAKVVTVLSDDFNVSVIDSRTRDISVVQGDFALAKQGLCRMEPVARDTQIAAGDIVITSGTNLYPKNLFVGTVQSIQKDESGLSNYAVIQPADSVSEIRDVFVITNFSGKDAAGTGK